jgi:stage II sporulation protein M
MLEHLYRREWVFFSTELWEKFKWLLLFSAFCFGLVYVFFIQNPQAQGKFLKSVMEALQAKGLLGLGGKSSFILAEKIFLNNLQATFLFTILGFIPFFPGPILFVLLTSTLLGGTFAASVTKGFGVWPFLKLTAPHGIFELFAVFYGASLGAYFSKEITKKILFWAHGESRPFSFLIKQILTSYPLVIIPLLAVAAFIEAFVTPLLK